MKVFNVEREDWDDEWGPGGFHRRTTRVGPRIGAAAIGATLYELPPGEATWPYHYEYGNEEWAIVVSGRPTLRTPDGERELGPGDAVCFAEGPSGAHAFRNATVEPARMLVLSTTQLPKVAVYPDSAKLSLRTGNEDDSLVVRRDSAVDYWEGEV